MFKKVWENALGDWKKNASIRFSRQINHRKSGQKTATAYFKIMNSLQKNSSSISCVCHIIQENCEICNLCGLSKLELRNWVLPQCDILVSGQEMSK